MEHPSVSDGLSATTSTVSCSMRLCERCQKIPFDDGKYGGFVGQSDTGHDCLKFDEDDKELTLEVDFLLVDSWPELDVLTGSAKSCELCEILRLQLRETTFQARFDRGKIKIEISYEWKTIQEHYPSDDYALMALFALVNGQAEHEESGWVILAR